MPLRNETVYEPAPKFDFDIAAGTPPFEIGRLYWDTADETLAMIMNDGTWPVTQQIGQEQHVLVRNNTGSAIGYGEVGYLNGSVAFRPTIALAKADSISTSDVVVMTLQAIPINEQGVAATFGLIREVDTLTPNWNEGDLLYLSETTAGALKNTVPTSGYTIPVGRVLRRSATDGIVFFCPCALPAFGDVVGGNHTEFEHDGTMVAVGNATTWKDENFDPIRGLGASAPGLVNLDTTSIQIVAFDGANTLEQVSSHRELQHDYKEGTDIVLHVHWMPVNANAGNVEWFIEYYIKTGNTTFATGTVSAIQAAPGVAWQEQRLDVATLDGASFVIGAQVSLRLYRDPGVGNPDDTYGSDAAVPTFGYHYQMDTTGSRQVTTK